ncbi:MAG: hypothetical protein AABX51_07420 [Nanoarchaeota archaeon]
MAIYQNLSRVAITSLPQGTVGLPARVIAASSGFLGDDLVMVLELFKIEKENHPNEYSLIGKPHIYDFLREAGVVRINGIEGKVITAYVNGDSSVIQGVSPNYSTPNIIC